MSDLPGGGSPTIRPERLSTVERAFQLARSGACNNPSEIALALKREHYGAVDAHLAGPSIRQSLRKGCEMAKEARRAGREECR